VGQTYAFIENLKRILNENIFYLTEVFRSVNGLSVRTKDSTMRYSKHFSGRRFQTFRRIVDFAKDIYSKLELQTRTRNKCTVLIFARNIVFNFCSAGILSLEYETYEGDMAYDSPILRLEIQNRISLSLSRHRKKFFLCL